MSFLAALIPSLALGANRSSFDSASWETCEPQHIRCDIVATLVPRLSQEAAIVLPEDDTFATFLIRASSPRIQPSFYAIVEPATQEDVEETVRYSFPAV